ncbi:hypothetical protein M9Y10_009698 [Tritrichomonas musculus]|uniref:BEACH domain-containing protein n=1 Tax=Tritrichomonas musculus TaxID=1915356 RepID=A0ABR2IQ90_9EUKA
MNASLIIIPKATNPDNIGSNASIKNKKLSIYNIFIKYLTSTGKEIKDKNIANMFNSINNKINKLLKKNVFKKKRPPSKDDINFQDLLQSIDLKQIDFSEFQEIFEVISSKEINSLPNDSLNIIFTQTKNANGALPTNIEVFLYRYLIINIFNTDSLVHDKDEQFLSLLSFLFSIPLTFIEEAIFLLSIVFNDLTNTINVHISNEGHSIDLESNQFIENLSKICINYLFDETLTNQQNFTTFEMQSFLQAHFIEQIIYFDQNSISHLKHVISALTKINISISRHDIQFFYGPLIKTTSYFIKKSLNQILLQEQNSNNDNLTISFIFFLMDKMFLISHELVKINNFNNDFTKLIEYHQKMFDGIPVDFAVFIDYLIDTSKWTNSLQQEIFSKFSEKEKNLFNNDKNYKETDSSIIESTNQHFSNLQQLSTDIIRKDLRSIVEYTLISFNNDAAHLNKFIKQVNNYEHKILLIILLKELTFIILNQIRESRTMKSAAKMLILMNVLLNLSTKDFADYFNFVSVSKSSNDTTFSEDLFNIFVFDEKYFYFTNPTLKSSVLYAFLSYNDNDSLFNIVENLPSDLELYENLRKSILSLYCKHFQTFSETFIDLITKKIDNSVQPQVSNFFISMLRLFYQIQPDLAIKALNSSLFFDTFSSKYLKRLRSYYIFYEQSESQSTVADYVQAYRYNSMMLIVQFSQKPSHIQALFSSLTAIDFIFNYGLFEEDYFSLLIEIIKQALSSFETASSVDLINYNPDVDNIITTYVTTIQNLADSVNKNPTVKDLKGNNFDYSSYCLNVLHNLLTVFGECIYHKPSVFANSLVNNFFPSIICEIPNKILPIDNQKKVDIINDILFIICGLTKDNDEFKKRFVRSMKKQKLAQILNSIELDDQTVKFLLMLIFEKEIDLADKNIVADIKYNKALPFLHVALLNRKQYYKIFMMIYEITMQSLMNKIQIYKSKLLSLFIVEIQKYPDFRKMTLEQQSNIDLMFNTFQAVTSSFCKPRTLLEVLITLQKRVNNQRPWYVSKFIKIFNIILNKSDENEKINNKIVRPNSSSISTSFFHFNGNQTGISIPNFSISDKEEFTFVCRFQLDNNYNNTSISKPTLLYFTTSDNKFKLFFEKSVLSIKHKSNPTKSKGKVTSDIEKVHYPFMPNLWYTMVLKGTSNDKLELFINSSDKPVHSLPIKHCTLDTINSFTVANSSIEKQKGLSCNVSVIYFFNKAMSTDKIKEIMSLPIKFCDLFTPSNQLLYPDLPRALFNDDKFEKSLLFCYNANMYDGQVAVNLVRGNESIATVKGINVPYNSSFTGAITSLGGITAFLPLLEIIDLAPFGTNSSEEDGRSLLNMILEIFISLNHCSIDFENEFCKSDGIQAFAHCISNISKKDIDKFSLPPLYNFYFSFNNEINQAIFLQAFWFNYNVWDKMPVEQHSFLLTNCLQKILSKHYEIFKKYISYSFLVSMFKDIPDDNVRDVYFTFIIMYSKYYFIKEDQKFFLHLSFTSKGVFQGQILKTFYAIMESGNECFYRLYGTNVYSNLIALSTSSNEETRIYVVKILVWMKNSNKKEPIPLNLAILSFIKTLNFENITDRSWIELEKMVLDENKMSERIVELLPLFACYSHFVDPQLPNNFITKLFENSKKNHDNFKLILLSPNWVLNLFYIYLNSKKPIIDLSDNHSLIDYFQNIFIYLLTSQNLDEYRNSLNELYLIQYIHNIETSLFIRQIFNGILQRQESESPYVYKVILPDIFAVLFYIPSISFCNETIIRYDHQKDDLNWIDYISKFNFNSKSTTKSRAVTFSKDDSAENSSQNAIHYSSSDSLIKIKIDFSNLKGTTGMRINSEGKWSDVVLAETFSKRFIEILKSLQGKQVDKVMTVSGHNSYKLSISCFDFFTIIEFILINVGKNAFDTTFSLVSQQFIKSSPNKKQTLQIICYLVSQNIIDNRSEILFNCIKTEFPKEVDGFIKYVKKTSPDEDVRNKLNEKSVQLKFFEYFYKSVDIFELVNNDCVNYFKNTKELNDLAKSALDMIQQESHILMPRYKFVQHFTDLYPFIRLNMKNICLSAYKKVSQEIIGYESGTVERTNLHWRISNRVDYEFRRIYLKVNHHFDYEKYKKLSNSTNKDEMNTALQAISSSSKIKIESSKELIEEEEEQDSDDNDDDVNNIDSLCNYNENDDEDEENEKISPTNSSSFEQNNSNNNNNESSIQMKQKENYLFTTKSVLIMVSKHFSGSLSIDRNKLVFIGKEMNSLMNSTDIPDKYLSSKKKPEEKEENNIIDTSSNTKTIQVQLSDIKWILLRNYLHIKEGIEIFLSDQKSYFFFLTEFNRSTVINYFIKHRKDLPNCSILQTAPEKIRQIMSEFKITESWVNGYLSNYSYLIYLNLFAGRSFNDTTQYPVFPWILNEYNKDEIDLNDESIYRDLSKPILLQNPEKMEKAKETYDMVDNDDEDSKIHNYLFYSNDMDLSILMLRIEPFTTTYLNTQPDFDVGRFPSSISKLFNAATEKNGFELIPEFFTTPEALVNNDHDIVVENDSFKKAILPNWVIDQSPADFIKKHRLALESAYVSSHLNEWIDLIFGFAQTGREAINRLNTYPPKLYPRYMARHRHQIKEDPMLFQDVQNRAFCFGIVPNQLFFEKHPHKATKIPMAVFANSGKFTSKSVDLTEITNSNSDQISLSNSNLNLTASTDNLSLNPSRNSPKPFPLFVEGNESVLIVLTSDSKLTVYSSKNSFQHILNDHSKSGQNAQTRMRANSTQRARRCATDLSSFILLKSRFKNTEMPQNAGDFSLTKRFCFLSNKLVVTSPWESEIRVFKIKPEYFLDLITHSSASASDCIMQDCLDLTYKKSDTGVFSLYSTIQLHCMILMTCKAGPREFLTVSNDFSISKWILQAKKSDTTNDELISTNNNYEFGTSNTPENSLDSPTTAGAAKNQFNRRVRKSSISTLKLVLPFLNRVKMVYKIIPHSTKIVAIGALNKINILASCDKDKNLILSRLDDGVFIRSFKTPHKVKALLVSETPCIVISMTYKNKNEVNNNDDNLSLSNDSTSKYVTTIKTYSINNSKNDNVNEEHIAERNFEKKFLTAWCSIDLCFGCDNYVACCFSDKSLVILSLPMLSVHFKTTLSANATYATFIRPYSVLSVSCKDGSLFKLKC